ncbi:MAG TPA: multicopper oxidase domain-containing protein [Thermoanaerobaculia bacterium]|nr:multicopper oxidase domain-containing protein [Thermoanaerobaculia bacterium]
MKAHHHHDHHSPAAASDAMAEPPSNDPRTVRIALEARETNWEVAPGVTIAGFGYNGQVPGPPIELTQGVPVEIEFTNRLAEPTLIHWHGLRIPAAMDGTQSTQRPVEPGETFTYRFTRRDFVRSSRWPRPRPSRIGR